MCDCREMCARMWLGAWLGCSCWGLKGGFKKRGGVSHSHTPKISLMKDKIIEYLNFENGTFSGLLRHCGLNSVSLYELRCRVLAKDRVAMEVAAMLEDYKLKLEEEMERHLLYDVQDQLNKKVLLSVWQESKKRSIYDYVGGTAFSGVFNANNHIGLMEKKEPERLRLGVNVSGVKLGG